MHVHIIIITAPFQSPQKNRALHRSVEYSLHSVLVCMHTLTLYTHTRTHMYTYMYMYMKVHGIYMYVYSIYTGQKVVHIYIYMYMYNVPVHVYIVIYMYMYTQCNVFCRLVAVQVCRILEDLYGQYIAKATSKCSCD